MDRRSFLRGASACAIAATVPPAVRLPETYRAFIPARRISMAEALAMFPQHDVFPPEAIRHAVFDGCVGVYNGVIIRQVDMIRDGRAELWA